MTATTGAGLEAAITVTREEGFTLDVTLTMPPATTVALLGPNGAGKSTTAAALAGDLAIDAGRIVLDGRVLDDPERGVFVPREERHIGVVFQDGLLFPHLSVLDNVAFGVRARGATRGEARTQAAQWLERLGSAELAPRKPRRLSGGEAQRVALARALAADPAVLIMDEPLAALDVSGRLGLRRFLAEHLGRFPGPRLLITHDPVEAFLLADHVYVVEGGRVTQSGVAEAILRHPMTPYAADLAGINLIRGTASEGSVQAAGGHVVHVADTTVTGPVLLTIHPRSIALHTSRPGGSPRNTWPTTVSVVERIGDRARIQLGPPLPLTAEVTAEAVDGLGLTAGSSVWPAIKATEIRVTGDPPP